MTEVIWTGRFTLEQTNPAYAPSESNILFEIEATIARCAKSISWNQFFDSPLLG
jgi:hypothetical protein